MSQDITSSVARLSYKGDAFVNARLSAAGAAVARVLARKAEETIVLTSQFVTRNLARFPCILLSITANATRR